MKKKMITVVLSVILVSVAGSVFGDEMATDWFLGFFKGYDRENHRVTVLAAYREFVFEVDGVEPEVLQNCLIGDLIEFGVYRTGKGYVMTSIMNHRIVEDEHKFKRITEEYKVRREEILSRFEYEE